MNDSPRTYLDHAATSWPKSEAVLEAMSEFARRCGAAAGRGSYRSATEADRVVGEARRQIARAIHAESSRCVSLHSSGTAALNAAIHGVVRPGDHVVTTAAEHNSVLRPLFHLQRTGQVQLTVVACDDRGHVAAEDVAAAVTARTRLVAVTHASNVTGAVQPVGEIASRISSSAAMLLCDAAQTFGYLPVDVRQLGADLLAAPGHKGAGGPLGTAFLYVASDHHRDIVPTVQGGTGSDSESLEMPSEMPGKLESGNLNVPALAGLRVALQEMEGVGADSAARRCRGLAAQLGDGLRSIDGLRLFGTPDELPIASMRLGELSPADLAAILDAEFGIETRAGLHCAALVHRSLGSQGEGTLRVSAGRATRDEEIDALLSAVTAIARQLN